MCQAFGMVGVQPTRFSAPDKELFTSSGGAVGVEAFVKARQGYLFPLPCGLCFLESVCILCFCFLAFLLVMVGTLWHMRYFWFLQVN